MRTTVCVGVVSSVGFTMVPSSASADDLDDRRRQVVAQLSQSQQELGESSEQLDQAARAVQSAQRQLVVAQQDLAGTRAELSTAQDQDVAKAAKLKAAQAELAQAKAAVAAGQRGLDAEQRTVGAMARDQYQQQTNLLPIAMLVQSQSLADVQTRLQWSTTMFDSAQAQLDRLKVLQRSLKAEKARQAQLEQQVAADRAVAAASLVTKNRLERRAEAQTAAVAGLVRQRSAARATATAAVAADRQQVADLDRERASVEHRIAVRIAAAKAAAAKAAAARKAAAVRAARLAAQRAAEAERARQVRLAAQERARSSAARKHHTAVQRARLAAAQERASLRAARKERAVARDRLARRHQTTVRHVEHRSPRRPSPPSGRGHHGFIYPVSGSITSPYGRRFHPVLHVWKLHDGTDFHASCGTPIRAAYSGRVAERYYNGAYGNRLMIDHGLINGRFVTTGYNHAQRYRVRVGQHVRKGQVVGYAGATGYSTGCHLHLMVWLDGRRVNPMSWY